MHAPLHSHSVTCAHAHIRVGVAINACPSTLVFSDLCSHTHELGWQSMPAPLHSYSATVLTHTYELGWQSLHAPLHSYSVTGAHAHTSWAGKLCRPPLDSYSVTGARAHTRFRLAINACPSTLVFCDLCSSTHTSWASFLCLPLYTRIQ
jgi:hypothetical protein